MRSPYADFQRCVVVSLIAVILGRLQMSVKDCKEVYKSMFERIFEKKRHRFNARLEIQGRFDSIELEKSIKQVLRDHGLAPDALLRDPDVDGCKVLVFRLHLLHPPLRVMSHPTKRVVVLQDQAA